MRRKRAEEEEGGEATTFTFRNEYILSAGSIPTHTHAHTDFDDLHTDLLESGASPGGVSFTSIRGTSSTILSLSFV
jgi:hypothetical protein